MTHRQRFGRQSSVLICLSFFLGSSVAQQRGEEPETVMVTLRAKPGAEAELARVIARHWATARDMKLVRDTPHLTMRGLEKGDRVYFIDIFTWRDAHVPDAAPIEIRSIWADMNRLVEARGGHPGLEFEAVTLVAP
jgi:hypothetical protein